MTTHFNDKREEDADYTNKIQELANENLALFGEMKKLKKFITNELNGSELQPVIEGDLIARDMEKLYMPFKQVLTHDFLTAGENQIVNSPKVNQDCRGLGFIVRVLGPTLQMYPKTIELKTIWETPKTTNYVLTTNWCNFVKEHKDVLKEGAKIRVWSFRIDRQLCFAITCEGHKIPYDGENDDVGAA